MSRHTLLALAVRVAASLLLIPLMLALLPAIMVLQWFGVDWLLAWAVEGLAEALQACLEWHERERELDAEMAEASLEAQLERARRAERRGAYR